MVTFGVAMVLTYIYEYIAKRLNDQYFINDRGNSELFPEPYT